MIQEPFSDDVIGAPLKVDGPALPGALEWNRASLKGREGVACSNGRHSLADHDGPWPGPGVEHRRIRRLTAVVRGQHQVNRHGLGLGNQLDEPQLIKVAGEQKVPASMRNVKHQAAGVIRGLGVPVCWRMEHRELRRALVPGCRGGDRAHRDAVCPNLVQEQRGPGVLLVHESGWDHNLADLEPVQQIRQRVVMILVDVASFLNSLQ